MNIPQRTAAENAASPCQYGTRDNVETATISTNGYIGSNSAEQRAAQHAEQRIHQQDKEDSPQHHRADLSLSCPSASVLGFSIKAAIVMSTGTNRFI